MIEAVLIIIALAIIVLLCGAIPTLWASRNNPDKPLESVKLASWKGYTVTSSVWFWTRVRAVVYWVWGKLKGSQ